MKNTFWKNLFLSLSSLGMIALFELIISGILFICPILEIKLIIAISMMGGLIAFFAIGFYWIFQTVVIDELGICTKLFVKRIRNISWEKVESIEISNRFRSPEIKINIKDEKPLYLDQRKAIVSLINRYKPNIDKE